VGVFVGFCKAGIECLRGGVSTDLKYLKYGRILGQYCHCFALFGAKMTALTQRIRSYHCHPATATRHAATATCSSDDRISANIATAML
jgi:hypothetical protein